MRDRTRRFTVGLGHEGPQHLQVLAADAKTKAWSDRNGYVLAVAVRMLDAELTGFTVTDESVVAWRPPAADVKTTAQVAQRFGELLRLGFPEETVVVTAAAPRSESYALGG